MTQKPAHLMLLCSPGEELFVFENLYIYVLGQRMNSCINPLPHTIIIIIIIICF